MTDYYDQTRGQWIASKNGRVIGILSITDGKADLDVDGSGQPASTAALAALGITDAERARVAALYQPGQSLWRVPITHFTPWDHNWPYGPPAGATGPNQPDPDQAQPPAKNPCDQPNASVIGCQSQSLGEDLSVAGAPFRLHYQSNRTPGRKDVYTLRVPITGANVPPNLKRINLEIDVAGQTITQTFPLTTPNQSYTFTWNGKDVYGRVMRGGQSATARIGYVYQAVYQEPANFEKSFGALSGVPLTRNIARQEITSIQELHTVMGLLDERSQGLGGWDLSVHHPYDPGVQTLYLGDGGQRNAQTLPLVITTVAGDNGAGCSLNDQPSAGACYGGDGGPATRAQLYTPFGLTMGPDGSAYIADSSNGRVRRVGPGGIITTVAGNGAAGSGGDGGPATQAQLTDPIGLALGVDGSLYIADAAENRVRRVAPDGIITTIAGDGSPGCNSQFSDPACIGGDGGPATGVHLNGPRGLALGPDGSLYIADMGNNRVRRVGPDGVITTVGGSGNTTGPSGDGGPAPRARLDWPYGLAVGPDGSLYVSERGIGDSFFGNTVRRVGPDGVITTVVGSLVAGYGGDGGPATKARLNSPKGITVGSDGSLYIADSLNNRIRKVDPSGVITTIAGTGAPYFYANDGGDGGPATGARLAEPVGVVIGPDGGLYIADTYHDRIRRVAPPLPGVSFDDAAIPSTNGDEVYVFDSAGRHLRTLDALTGAVRYRFGYDAAGRLATVTDGDGNATMIQHDASGNPTAIVAPGGQRTALTVDANGYLNGVTDPLGATTTLTYTADGLLTGLTDPLGNANSMAYDALGRLVQDTKAGGGDITLGRVEGTDGYTSTLGTALDATRAYTTTYATRSLPTGGQQEVTTDAAGLQATALIGTDGTSTITATDGTVTTLTQGPDPRFGMQAPLPQSLTITTPRGLRDTTTTARTVALADPGNLFSLNAMTDTVTRDGQTSRSVYDVASGVLTGTTPLGRQTVTRLDGQGRIVEAELPNQLPLRVAYDNRGRLNALAQDARAYALTYDRAGNLVGTTDPLSRTTGLGYDAAGRAITQTLPDGHQVGFAYDTAGDLTALTPPGRSAYRFTYTPRGLVQDEIAPSAGAGTTAATTRYTYTRDGQTASVTRPDGTTVTYGYDAAGRLATVSTPGGQVASAYDPATGNLSVLTAPDGGTIAYGYDGSLPTSTSYAGTITGTVARTYDNSFRLASESVNGDGPIAYRYDADGLLTGAGGLSLSRDPANGRVAGSALGSITDTLGYGDYGDVTSYGASNGADSLFATSYARDALSRVAAVTETVAGASHTDAYTYDAAGRLTGVTRDGAMIGQYAYDANGNRTSVTESGGTTNAVYDARDRLLTNGTTTYTYTANGEVASQLAATGAMTSYAYDAFGNLTGATLPDGTRVTYSLDGTGRRIGVQVDGAPVQGFLYDDTFDNPVAELDGAGNVVARFVYATGSTLPYYMVKGGTTYRIISDHLGSPRLVVDASTGAVAQRMDYDAWGNVTRDTNPGFQPFGFAGGLYDRRTGLTHFGAREYDAATGRWTTPDPLLFAGGGTNLYAYVLNDPINHADPSGGFVDPLSVGIGALAGAATNVVGTYTAASAQGKWPTSRQVFASAVGGAVGGGIGALGGPLTNGVGNAIGQLVTNYICPGSGSVTYAFFGGLGGSGAAAKRFGSTDLSRLNYARAYAKRGITLLSRFMARAEKDANQYVASQFTSGGLSQLTNLLPSPPEWLP